MANRVAQLIDLLDADPWRDETPLSANIEQANSVLLDETASHESREQAASIWLQRYQPCLFGRIAARKGLIHHCFLTDRELRMSDEVIRDKLQLARRTWRQDALQGRRSAIIVWALSRKLVNALPGPTLMALAKRLLSLYLRREISEDDIELDDIFLRVPGNPDTIIKWSVGINYFGTQGDGRWWQDHRIPGGLAFSLNSVGHLVKSGKLTSGLADLRETLGLESEEGEVTAVDSLEKALEFAMRTINLASDAPSGKATQLRDLSGSRNDPPCPVVLPSNLSGKDHCTYEGLYHTDVSIPSEYFEPSVLAPQHDYRSLDFTYLFHRDVDNPDHETTGEGLPIAGADSDSSTMHLLKNLRTKERIVSGAELELLMKDLGEP